MVLVSSFMVHPRQGNSRLPSFGIVRASESLIIPGTAPELDRSILADVVKQSLSDKSQPQTVPADQSAMFCNCPEMFYRMHVLAQIIMTIEKLSVSAVVTEMPQEAQS